MTWGRRHARLPPGRSERPGKAGALPVTRWSGHPTVRFLAVAVALLVAYHGYLYLTGPSRMTDRLRARLAGEPATVDVLVTTKFPPEEFHIRLLQQVGNMRGVEGSTTKLFTVTPANVRYLSRHYWIRRIDLVAGDGRNDEERRTSRGSGSTLTHTPR